jgi:predicted MPP superfamily phosphohydrolase
LFSFIQVTDTQFAQAPAVNSIVNFILNNETQYNIQYVIHTGDIVWEHDNVTSWDIMNSTFSRLKGQVPFGWLAGNHDYNNKTEYIGKIITRLTPTVGALLLFLMGVATLRNTLNGWCLVSFHKP